jgi:hypothetical protein
VVAVTKSDGSFFAPVVASRIGWMLALALVLASCAGEVVPTPRPDGVEAGPGSDGAMEDAGPPIDTCVLQSMKVCQSSGCHGGTPISAGLNLETNVLTKDYRTLVDQPNHGDNSGCMAGQFKLIDSANAENSLLYTKLPGAGTPPPCGLRMPVIGNFAAKDKTCILSWIESVIAASR